VTWDEPAGGQNIIPSSRTIDSSALRPNRHGRPCAGHPQARDAVAGVLDGYMLSQLVRDRRARRLRAARLRHQQAKGEAFLSM
jgi:hypothetical protein